jgi:hypothetical protein
LEWPHIQLSAERAGGLLATGALRNTVVEALLGFNGGFVDTAGFLGLEGLFRAPVADYDRIRNKIEIAFPDFRGFNVRIRAMAAFYSTSRLHAVIGASPTRCRYSGDGICEGPRVRDADLLPHVTTLLTHGRHITTIYD